MRLSGLQKEVLSLYRQCLRESRKKPQVGQPCRQFLPFCTLTWLLKTSRPHFVNFIRYVMRQVLRTRRLLTQHRTEFSRNLAVEKRDFAAIEFLLRKGKRQLDAYSAPGIKDIH